MHIHNPNKYKETLMKNLSYLLALDEMEKK